MLWLFLIGVVLGVAALVVQRKDRVLAERTVSAGTLTFASRKPERWE